MQRKKRPVRLLVFVAVIAIAGMLLVPQMVQASGLVGFEENQANKYSMYELEHYDLDFYVDMSWSWLPWNWGEAVGRSVSYGLYVIANGIWLFSRYISYGTGEILAEAYRFDILNELTDSLALNIQKLAGVSASGFSADGFLPGFMMWIIVAVGVYVAYAGLYKRQISKAMGAVINVIVIFIGLIAFVVYAPTCIRSINELSADICTECLEIGTNLVLGDAHGGTGDSVDALRDELFEVQIYQPWLLLQYGTTDVSTLGAERVNSLVMTSPQMNYGQDREEIVKTEIETYQNMRMTVPMVAARFGEVLVIFLVNLFISIFVILLSALMILTQIIFIIYVMFLVISLVFSMFPGCSGLAKRSVLKVFNIVLLRAGYILIMTLTFTISTMIYQISENHSFFVIGFLQIIVFAGIFLNQNEILGFMLLQPDRGAFAVGLAGGAIAAQKLRKGVRMQERRAQAGREKAVAFVAGGARKAMLTGAGKLSNGAEKLSSRYVSGLYRARAADSAASRYRQQKTADYSVSGNTPRVNPDAAEFHRGFSGQTASSGEIYDKYYNRMHGHDLKEPRPYKVSRNEPVLNAAGFYDRKNMQESTRIAGQQKQQKQQSNAEAEAEVKVKVKEMRERYGGRVPGYKHRHGIPSEQKDKSEQKRQAGYRLPSKENIPRVKSAEGLDAGKGHPASAGGKLSRTEKLHGKELVHRQKRMAGMTAMTDERKQMTGEWKEKQNASGMQEQTRGEQKRSRNVTRNMKKGSKGRR